MIEVVGIENNDTVVAQYMIISYNIACGDPPSSLRAKTSGMAGSRPAGSLEGPAIDTEGSGLTVRPEFCIEGRPPRREPVSAIRAAPRSRPRCIFPIPRDSTGDGGLVAPKKTGTVGEPSDDESEGGGTDGYERMRPPPAMPCALSI
jgi:hypothetical protein